MKMKKNTELPEKYGKSVIKRQKPEAQTLNEWITSVNRIFKSFYCFVSPTFICKTN